MLQFLKIWLKTLIACILLLLAIILFVVYVLPLLIGISHIVMPITLFLSFVTMIAILIDESGWGK